jgi:hypothetical protein
MVNIFHNSVEEYFSIEDEPRLEYYNGQIHTKGGPPVVLLGGSVLLSIGFRFNCPYIHTIPPLPISMVSIFCLS